MAKRRPKNTASKILAFSQDALALTKEGITARQMDRAGIHWRITGVHGLVVDYWPTTTKFIRQGSRLGGHGLEVMLKALREEVAEERDPDMVTIFTDASFDHRDRSGGWACWCKKGGGRGNLMSGMLRSGPINAEIAEAMAICNALFSAKKGGYITKGSTVMIQSDCINALGKIHKIVPGARNSPAPGGLSVGYSWFRDKSKASKELREQYLHVLNTIANLVVEMHLTLLLRHVKGHTGKSDARSWVNAECDKAARAKMVEMRQELKGAA